MVIIKYLALLVVSSASFRATFKSSHKYFKNIRPRHCVAITEMLRKIHSLKVNPGIFACSTELDDLLCNSRATLFLLSIDVINEKY